MSESKIIGIIKSKFSNYWETSYGNDCAFLADLNQNSLLITKDVLVEGTHFEKDYPIDSIAYKSLAVNISDILSDGGKPKYFLLGIGYPQGYENKIIALFDNYYNICKEYDLKIIGGDLVYSPLFFISVTCIGYSSPTPWLRKNVKEKDFIYITGMIGGSYKGFREIKSKGIDKRNNFIVSHLYPPIRIKEIDKLAKKYKINSGIDISDGLIKDLLKLSIESNKSLLLDYNSIPFFPGLTEEEKFNSLFWGEDYEICFTSNEDIKEEFVKKIGYVEYGSSELHLKKDDKIIIYNNIEEIEKKGFCHW